MDAVTPDLLARVAAQLREVAAGQGTPISDGWWTSRMLAGQLGWSVDRLKRQMIRPLMASGKMESRSFGIDEDMADRMRDAGILGPGRAIMYRLVEP